METSNAGTSTGVSHLERSPLAAHLVKARVAASAMFFVLGCAIATWLSRLPAIQQRHHIDTSTLSLALLACSVGSVAGMRAAPWLGRRLGTPPLVAYSAVVFCIWLPLVGAANTFNLLCAAFFGCGFLCSMFTVNINANAALIERESKRSLMSSMHGLFSTGCIVGSAIGSFAANQHMPPVLHFVVVSIFMAVTAKLAQPMLLAAQPQPETQLGETDESGGNGRPSSYITQRTIGLCAIAFCVLVAEAAIGDWSGIYLRNNLHASDALAALGFAAFNITMCLGRFTGDVVTEKFGAANVVRAGSAFAGIGLAFGLCSNNQWAALLSFGAVGAGLATICPNVYSAAGRSQRSHETLAFVSMIGYLGLMSGAPIIGFTSARTGLPIAMGLIVLMTIIISLLSGCLRAERKAFMPSQLENAEANSAEELARI